jgi:hypothetical protein
MSSDVIVDNQIKLAHKQHKRSAVKDVAQAVDGMAPALPGCWLKVGRGSTAPHPTRTWFTI